MIYACSLMNSFKRTLAERKKTPNKFSKYYQPTKILHIFGNEMKHIGDEIGDGSFED